MTALVLAALAACSTPRNNAPVVERSLPVRPDASATAPSTAPVMTPVMTPAGPPIAAAMQPATPVDNAGKPGYYSVKPGDTLIRIGLENGQHWRDIARWNGIENANLIEVGQVLRVVPPGVDPGAVASKPVAVARAEARPLDARATAVAAPAAGPTGAAATAPGASAPIALATPALREGDEDVNWQWPASGAVAGTFEEGRSKGLAILGKAGDPVLAAADGRVVYAGSGLRGYGNLLIVKHNNIYLTAYAHNQTLLVKEDQPVRRGQKIAEMGSSDAERVQLHFEIRRQGQPIDPSRLLPAR